MSNFICEHCGAEIKEGPRGQYVTSCPHYPFDPRPGAKRLADAIDSDILAGLTMADRIAADVCNRSVASRDDLIRQAVGRRTNALAVDDKGALSGLFIECYANGVQTVFWQGQPVISFWPPKFEFDDGKVRVVQAYAEHGI